MQETLLKWLVSGAEWRLADLWAWTGLLERLAIYGLGLIFVYEVIVAVLAFRLYRAVRISSQSLVSQQPLRLIRRAAIVRISHQADSLRYTGTAAQYLGLAGTCCGMLDAFRGYVGTRAGFLLVTVAGIAAALLSTATGILVASFATWLHHAVRSRAELLRNLSISSEHGGQKRLFEISQRFPTGTRFSRMPAFAPIAVFALSFFLVGLSTFGSFNAAAGISVHLLKTGIPADSQISGGPIFIQIINGDAPNKPKIYVNGIRAAGENLESMVRARLNVSGPKAYVHADDVTLWRDVLNVIDTLEGLKVSVVLTTANLQPTHAAKTGHAARRRQQHQRPLLDSFPPRS